MKIFSILLTVLSITILSGHGPITSFDSVRALFGKRIVSASRLG